MWREQVLEIGSLREKLSPKLEVNFDPKDPHYTTDTWFSNTDPPVEVKYFQAEMRATSGRVTGCLGALLRVMKKTRKGNWRPTEYKEALHLQ